jgi:DNA-binding NarL/FixJ family response regulator
LRLVRETRPDVLLLDVQMPEMDGLAATREIGRQQLGVAVLILTTFDLDEYAYAALQAGASGFLLKTSPPGRLAEAIRAVAAGDSPLAPSVTRRLVERFATLPPPAASGIIPPQLAGLSPRELDVLRLVARGRDNREVAAATRLSEATVKTYLTRVVAKLGLRDRVQAVILAYETGLVTPGSSD